MINMNFISNFINDNQQIDTSFSNENQQIDTFLETDNQLITPAFENDNQWVDTLIDNDNQQICVSNQDYFVIGDHTALSGRDAADQHPISSITGLEDALLYPVSKTDDMVNAVGKDSEGKLWVKSGNTKYVVTATNSSGNITFDKTITEISTAIANNSYIVCHLATATGTQEYILSYYDSTTVIFSLSYKPSTQILLYNIIDNNNVGTLVSHILVDTIALNTALATKQDVLTAGNNITITNNVISATDTTYNAGTGISIANNTINATIPSITLSFSQIVSQSPVIAELTSEQASIVEDETIGNIYVCFDETLSSYFGNAVFHRAQQGDTQILFINSREESAEYILYTISTKRGEYGAKTFATSSDLSTHTSNTNIHTSASEKATWNSKSVVSVSATGTSTDKVDYITIDGVEKQLPTGKEDYIVNFTVGASHALTSDKTVTEIYNAYIANKNVIGKCTIEVPYQFPLSVATSNYGTYDYLVAFEFPMEDRLLIFTGTNSNSTDTFTWGTYIIPSALSELSTDSTHRVVTDTQISTWNAKSTLKAYTENNPLLTPTSNECTWTVSASNHGFSTTSMVIQLYEVATDAMILTNINIEDNYDVTIKFASTANISADTYRVVIMG